jgi:hypothetical protein
MNIYGRAMTDIKRQASQQGCRDGLEQRQIKGKHGPITLLRLLGINGSFFVRF